ncbi:N-methylhydantoinase B [Mesorhizobium australicum]|uniref:N-methylhydantoinase B n=2 Tax=Mesorhizobium australicum TaxID=536018 RepID=A0A1X7N0B4_9HYPH|nr:N-methylhydantoinase B [Mesorhizobium australicum]
MDAVTLAVVRGALEQIVDEMDLNLIHAALSPIISETNDCAHGLYDARTGETIAQGGYGLPMFLANMQFTVQRIIPVVEAAGGFKPGDIWITNDPYLSGTHLNDVILISPHFVDGELFALFANTGHWMDMGGSAPGGWVPTATEIHQEGIVIPPLKLLEGGRRNDGVVAMITANVRLPQQLLGDMAAMINVFAIGRRGLDDLVARYGVDTLRVCIAEMMARSEADMRSYIAEIPDGSYELIDYFDNDGVVDQRLEVKLKLVVEGSDLHFDFTGTVGPAVGPMNISDATTRSLCFVALKHVFPEVPVNGGAFRPTSFTIPDRSILAASYPSAVGGTTDVTQRVVDLVFGTLAQAIPDKTPAAPFGTTGVVSVSGHHPDSGRYYVAVYPYPGGYGGSRASDGLVNGTPPGSMAKFMSVEMSEHRYPVHFEYFAIREGSAGHGEHRGGCGTAYGIATDADAVVSILGDRVDHAPFGVQGGGPAAPNKVELRTDGKTWIPPMRSKATKVNFHKGDAMHLGSPGGGGFGSPMLRDPRLIEDDLNDGLIDLQTACDIYGVVVADTRTILDRTVYRVDGEATRAHRESRRTAA